MSCQEHKTIELIVKSAQKLFYICKLRSFFRCEIGQYAAIHSGYTGLISPSTTVRPVWKI